MELNRPESIQYLLLLLFLQLGLQHTTAYYSLITVADEEDYDSVLSQVQGRNRGEGKSAK